MGYGDLFSPGSFIINPCLDLWGFMGTLTASVTNTSNSMAKVLSCNAGKGAKGVGTILALFYQVLSFCCRC